MHARLGHANQRLETRDAAMVSKRLSHVAALETKVEPRPLRFRKESLHVCEKHCAISSPGKMVQSPEGLLDNLQSLLIRLGLWISLVEGG